VTAVPPAMRASATRPNGVDVGVGADVDAEVVDAFNADVGAVVCAGVGVGIEAGVGVGANVGVGIGVGVLASVMTAVQAQLMADVGAKGHWLQGSTSCARQPPSRPSHRAHQGKRALGKTLPSQ